MTKKSARKQTRLSFQPLASSSPVTDNYSVAVHNRLASVRFEGSSPRRSTRSTKQSDGFDTLPTPEASSQPHGGHESAPSPIQSRDTPVKHVSKDREERESEEDDDDIVLPSSKRRRTSNTYIDRTPTRKSSRLLSTPQSNLSLRSQRRTGADADWSSVDNIGSPETSGDEADAILTKPITQQRSAPKTQSEDPFVVSDDDTGEAHRPTPRKSRTTSNRPSRQEHDFVVEDDQVEYISSDEMDAVLASRNKDKKTKRRKRTSLEQDELDEDLKDLQTSEVEAETDSDHGDVRRTRGGPVTTQRDRAREHLELLRRRRAGEKIPRVLDSDEDDTYGFEDDDGVDIDEITRERPLFTDQSRNHIQIIDSSSDDEEVAGVDHKAFNDDDYDDNFIVDDEEDAISIDRNGHTAIPIALTRYATMKPRELFRYIIEWLVKNKIAPAFARSDELYVLSFNKVNDQIKAQAGSRLISSAWNAEFKYTILARPQMTIDFISGGDDEAFLDCDACNRTNHPARYEFRLSGHAYDADTLEPINEDADGEDETDDDEDNDRASYDQAGHLLRSVNTAYRLGRFCAANAEMGHKLTHWKYHLNEALLSYLEEQGVLSAEAIVARDKLSKKKRETEAENIVDVMDDTGVIHEMWRGLQDDLEDARAGMEDHVAKKGGRRNKRIGRSRGY